MIWDIFNIHRKPSTKTLWAVICRFHKISKHISMSVYRNFCLMFCGLFAKFLKIIATGVGFSTIFLPQGSGFRTLFVPGGWGILPFKKSPGCLAGGDGLAWNWLIDYFIENERKNCKCFHFCGLSTESFLAMWMCQYKCLMSLMW